jgi:hypothetical protein
MADTATVLTDGRWLPQAAVLAFGTFAVGTDAFVIAGLLPEISHSCPSASRRPASWSACSPSRTRCSRRCSPLLAALTGNWSRRTVLVTALLVFAAGNVATAVVSGHLMVLAATRPAPDRDQRARRPPGARRTEARRPRRRPVRRRRVARHLGRLRAHRGGGRLVRLHHRTAGPVRRPRHRGGSASATWTPPWRSPRSSSTRAGSGGWDSRRRGRRVGVARLGVGTDL